MWLKKIRQKKLQYTLIALILAITALIFCTCLGFVIEVNAFSADYYAHGNIPDYRITTLSEDAVQILKEKQKNSNEVTEVNVYPSLSLNQKFYKNNEIEENEIVDSFTKIIGIENYQDLPYEVTLLQGDVKSKMPAMGEIWIPKLYSDILDIQVGDSIYFKNGEMSLKVTTLFNDALLPNGTASIGLEAFVNKNQIETFTDALFMYNAEIGLSESVLASQTAETYIADLLGEFNRHTIMTASAKSVIAGMVTMANILGGLGTLGAIMIFIVSIMVLQVIIRSNLLKEYRSIGIYKSQGLSNQKIRSFYVVSYIVVGVIALSLGAVFSLPFIKIMCDTNLKYLANFSVTGISFVVMLTSVIGLLIVVFFSTMLATKKVKKITPVAALQIGLTSSKKKLKQSIIKNAGTPFAMAINDIFKRKSMSIMIASVLTVSFTLCFLFYSMYDSISHVKQNSNVWFSVPKSQFMVSGKITDDVLEYLKKDTRVKDSNGITFIASTSIDINGSKHEIVESAMSATIIPTAISSYDQHWELPMAEGRGPKGTSEIAVSYGLMKSSNIRMGDYVEITINNQKANMLVVGVYGSMMNGGATYQLTPEAIKKYDESFVCDMIAIDLWNEADRSVFEEDLKAEFETLTIETIPAVIETAVISVEEMMVPASILLMIIFIVFSLLNIINCLAMENVSNRKQYGILKALGFNNGYVVARVINRIGILSIVSLGIGLLIHIIASPKLFFAMMSFDGLLVNIPATLLLGTFILTIIIITTLLCCLPIRKVSPTELMEE